VDLACHGERRRDGRRARDELAVRRGYRGNAALGETRHQAFDQRVGHGVADSTLASREP
jgi:hypothetical protein